MTRAEILIEHHAGNFDTSLDILDHFEMELPSSSFLFCKQIAILRATRTIVAAWRLLLCTGLFGVLWRMSS